MVIETIIRHKISLCFFISVYLMSYLHPWYKNICSFSEQWLCMSLIWQAGMWQLILWKPAINCTQLSGGSFCIYLELVCLSVQVIKEAWRVGRVLQTFTRKKCDAKMHFYLHLSLPSVTKVGTPLPPSCRSL